MSHSRAGCISECSIKDDSRLIFTYVTPTIIELGMELLYSAIYILKEELESVGRLRCMQSTSILHACTAGSTQCSEHVLIL